METLLDTPVTIKNISSLNLATISPVLDLTIEDEDDDIDYEMPKDPFADENTALKAVIKAYEDIVKETITKFFKNKQFHCGGPIPKNYLYSEQSIAKVMGTDFCDGIDECYEVISTLRAPKNHDWDKIDWDIYLVLELIAEVRSLEIPKPFQAGLILLYLKFCKGCRTPEKKGYDINHIIHCE